EQPDELQIFGHPRNVCQGSSVTLLDSIVGGSGPFTLSWTSSVGFNCINCNNTVSPNQSQQYQISVTDGNGCTATETVNLNVADAITATIEVIADTCGGTGSIIINAQGGSGPLTYIANGESSNENIFTGFEGGQTVDILVHDTVGCFYTETVIIPAAVLDLQETLNITAISCPGAGDGIIEVIAEETVVVGYAINDPNNIDNTSTFDGLQGGQYTVFIEDVNGCVVERTVNILDPIAPLLASTVVNNSCFGSNDAVLALSTNGGTFGIADFRIEENNMVQVNGVFTELPAGDYTIIATDVNGCEFDQILTVTQPDEILDTAFVTHNSCWDSENGEILMEVSGGAGVFDFSRDGVNFHPSPLFNELAPDDYNIIMRDTTGCVKTRQITITAPDTLQLQPNVTPASCPGEANGKIVIIVSGGTAIYEYKIGTAPFGPENTFLDLEASTYLVTVKDANNCLQDRYVEVQQSETPETEINTEDASCPEIPNGKIVIIVSGGTQIYEYAVNSGAYQLDNIFPDLTAGFYNVHIQNDSNCVFSYQVEVGSGPAMILDIETASWNDAALIDLTVYGGTPPFSYTWSSGEITQDIYVENNGDYIVIVSDDNGCEQTDTANVIRVSIDDLLPEREFTIYPNPSSNVVEIDLSDSNIEVRNIRITDARGRLVQHTAWPKNAQRTRLDISHLAEGNYQIALKSDAGVKIMRLVKIDQ
ncbi:MAG: T9SS type A sorting domain-containing protein, partial [Flavobacteriales bacterium]|nr:T9SS type A sorting domain-containing protein [Flavobacteriales bacterium]